MINTVLFQDVNRKSNQANSLQIKNRLQKEAYLSRSDGVTMVGHDQAPDRCGYGSSQPGPQMKPWHYADQKAWQWFRFDQAPKLFCGLRPIKRRDWFRFDHVPK